MRKYSEVLSMVILGSTTIKIQTCTCLTQVSSYLPLYTDSTLPYPTHPSRYISVTTFWGHIKYLKIVSPECLTPYVYC